MVLEFVKSGRHHDFLADVHAACNHLEDLLRLDHPDTVQDDLAAALSWPDALRMHVQRDMESLIGWHDELSRLLSRIPLAKVELDRIDPLDASRLQSVLNRAESLLSSAVNNYPEVVKFQKDESLRSPSFQGFVQSIHKNLAEARGLMSQIEEIVSRLTKRQAALLDQHDHFSRQNSLSSRQENVHAKSSSAYGELPPIQFPVEASSYLASQLQRGEIPWHDFAIALKKIANFVSLGNIPSIPSHAEPHCYGAAPDHLNGVVVGGQERLIYYTVGDGNRRLIRLCCWISHAEHKDAFSRLRHQNLYRRIITNNRSVKVTRKDFDGFVPLKE